MASDTLFRTTRAWNLRLCPAPRRAGRTASRAATVALACMLSACGADPAVTTTAPTPQFPIVAGIWDGTLAFTTPLGQSSGPFTLIVSQTGDAISGSFEGLGGGRVTGQITDATASALSATFTLANPNCGGTFVASGSFTNVTLSLSSPQVDNFRCSDAPRSLRIALRRRAP